MRPVADTTQRSIFDADYRDVTEPGPAGIEPDIGRVYRTPGTSGRGSR